MSTDPKYSFIAIRLFSWAWLSSPFKFLSWSLPFFWLLMKKNLITPLTYLWTYFYLMLICLIQLLVLILLDIMIAPTFSTQTKIGLESLIPMLSMSYVKNNFFHRFGKHDKLRFWTWKCDTLLCLAPPTDWYISYIENVTWNASPLIRIIWINVIAVANKVPHLIFIQIWLKFQAIIFCTQTHLITWNPFEYNGIYFIKICW